MKPYYDEDGVTIYHADCRDVLPLLAPVDLVLTDPPYGTGWIRGGGKRAGEFHARHEQPAWDIFTLDWLDLVSCASQFAVFCAVSRWQDMREKWPTCSQLRYRKSNVRPGGADYEPVAVYPAIADGEFLAYNGDAPFHPCQKPIEVMRWILGRLLPVGVVLDPFMGSGTTLRAAKDLGIKSIGIEIEEKYCEIAAKRMRQRVLFGIEEGEAA